MKFSNASWITRPTLSSTRGMLDWSSGRAPFGTWSSANPSPSSSLGAPALSESGPLGREGAEELGGNWAGLEGATGASDAINDTASLDAVAAACAILNEECDCGLNADVRQYSQQERGEAGVTCRDGQKKKLKIDARSGRNGEGLIPGELQVVEREKTRQGWLILLDAYSGWGVFLITSFVAKQYWNYNVGLYAFTVVVSHVVPCVGMYLPVRYSQIG
jgi:hypothetical protein